MKSPRYAAIRRVVNSSSHATAAVLNRLRRGGLTPWLGGLIVLVVAGIVIIPVAIVILSSFSAPTQGFVGNFTLEYLRAVVSAANASLLTHTLIFTFGASAIAMVVATALAWLMTFADMPCRRVVRLIPLAPLLMPPLMRDTAWIQLYSGRDGLVNIGLEKVFGLHHAPFNIFSLWGMTIDLGLNMVPITYIIVFPALNSLNRSLDEASRLSGAGTWRTLRRVTIPIIKPAMLSAFALCALVVAASFETPVLIGAPGGVGTYMSAIYRAVSGSGVPNYNLASAQADVYFVLNGLLLTWYLVSTRRESKFHTVAGRGYSGSGLLARWRWVLLIVPVVYFILAFGQLFVQSILVSFLPFYSTTAGFPFSHFTLSNYAGLFQGTSTRQAVINSLEVSAIVTILTVAVSILLAAVAFQTKVRGRRLIEVVGTLSLAIPPLVFSIALLITVLITPGLKEYYQTLVPLVVVDLVIFLPFSLRIVSASMLQISPELREAAAISGAGVTRRLVTISVPLIRVAIGGAAYIVFVMSFRELAGVTLLVGPNTPLVPTTALDLYFVGGAPTVSALNVVTAVVPALLTGTVLGSGALIRRLRHARQDWRREQLPSASLAAVPLLANFRSD
jgi:iron(III) transport system permease protein